MAVTKKRIIDILKTIPDPELGISIWDLGLVYDVGIDPKTGDVRLLMTLTSIGCPLFATIETVVREKLEGVRGLGTLTVDLTFDPPWTMDKMSDEAKAQLGLL
jgi:metal-sulfur cluster biosynthetic enzyme